MAAPVAVVQLVSAGTYHQPKFSIPFNSNTPCDQGSFTPTPTFPLDIVAALCNVMELSGKWPLFAGSRLFLDTTARAMMGTQGQWDIRTYLACCVNVLMKLGLPSETLWPYLVTNYNQPPSAACFAPALSQRLLTYINLPNDQTQLKACLWSGYPWVVVIVRYSGWLNDATVMGDGTATGPGSGVIYQKAGDRVMGTMAMYMWGWDDVLGGFWGQACLGGKGLGGNFMVPYAYMNAPANIVTDIWSLQTVTTGPPVDCQVGAWSAWDTCAASKCGTPGTQTQKRTNIPPTNGGAACPVDTTKTQACAGTPCPQDCLVTEWANPVCTPPASSAGVTCGWTGGTATMTRTTSTKDSNGGAACPSLSLTLPSTCDGPSCPPTDCLVGGWSQYGACDVTKCGAVGKQTSTRSVTKPALNGGVVCPTLTQTKDCTGTSCPVDCKVGTWSDWGPCSSTTCGTPGTLTSTRSVVTPPSNGGHACPTLTATQPCNPRCTKQIAALILVAVLVLLVALAVAAAFL